MNESHDPLKPDTCPACGTTLAGGLCPRCLMADAAQATQALGTAPGGALPSQAEVAAAFPQLEIIELIGAGGMGNVWCARQPTLDRFVALKLLPASITERDPAFAERFAREGQLLARLHHPNIVTVHDSGRAGQFFYLIMEFVDGVNLRQAMRAGRFTAEQALAIVPKICDALQYAHEEGVLHRDIKPENILLDAKGRVKLVDFGIAKLMAQTDGAPAGGAAPAQASSLTLGGTALGTPQYMAPEQMDRPADVDHRADIYSLGVVFYELLTGELPQGRFVPPSEKSEADPRVDGIVRQALEHERERRQGSVGELRTQVDTILNAPGVTGPAVAAAMAQGIASRVLPRFSRTAILGFLFALLPLLMLAFAEVTQRMATHPVMPDGTIMPNKPALLVSLSLLVASGLMGLAATILGWIAVAQIRRSGGGLHGMWLAVLDGLLFPLLVLDYGFLFGLWKSVQNIFVKFYANPSVLNDPHVHSPLLTRLANVLQLHDETYIFVWSATSTVVDLLIIQEVWRLVNRPPPGMGAATAAPWGAPARQPLVAPREPAAPARVSRSAIMGLFWAALCLPLPLIFLGLLSQVDERTMPWWVPILLGTLAVLGLTAPIGATVAGWAAVRQIQRSAGRVCGLRLAVFDGLLFPLLALDAFLGGLWIGLWGQVNGFPVSPWVIPLTLVTAAWADAWIIRRVWRALSRSPCAEPTPAPSSPWRTVGICLLALAGILTVIILALLFAPLPVSSSQAASGFGPDRECVLPEPAVGAACLLDFESGQFITPPKDLAGKLKLGLPDIGVEGVNWLRESGADAVVNVPNRESLRLFEGVAVSLSRNGGAPLKWEQFTREDVVAALGQAGWESGKRFVKSGHPFYATPATAPTALAFITREGSMGVMEIRGMSGNPRGLRIRYKLLQGGARYTAPPDDSLSLEQAVNDFNKRYHSEAVAAGQPPLTVEAVLAAIRWAMLDRPQLSVTNETFAALGRMTETKLLPKNFELELLTGYEPDDKATFDVWSVRLRIPGTVIPGGTTCIMIHEQQLGSHVIGEEERKVIHAWQDKVRAEGGVELGEGMQKYRREREAAAAIDSRNKPKP